MTHSETPKKKRTNRPARTLPDKYHPQVVAACKQAGILPAMCVGTSTRLGDTVRRYKVMTILRARGWTATQIGKALDRDHTTVLYGLGRYAQLLEIINGPTAAREDSAA